MEFFVTMLPGISRCDGRCQPSGLGCEVKENGCWPHCTMRTVLASSEIRSVPYARMYRREQWRLARTKVFPHLRTAALRG